jgi:hypothetical protein
MLPYFWYLLKVIICSGILFGYYWLFLRNKIFHQYNRFYLLAAMSLSLLLPLLKINFWQPATEQNQAIRVLQAVSEGDEYVSTIVIPARGSNWSFEQLYPLVYWLISIIFLVVMLRTIYLIRTLLKRYAVQKIEEVSFVNTEDDSTPFSFFKYIFWNSSIDINSTTGRQIFKHEVAHIEEKHTHDKLFVNTVLIFCWCNPFFWLYRKELNMIHEFIADKKAIENSDTAAFAAMILQAAYPRHRFELANNFFYSPIKRRLLMLTKNLPTGQAGNNPKLSYIARLMVLPLAVLVFAAFTFKARSIKENFSAAPETKQGTENIIFPVAGSPVFTRQNISAKIQDTIPDNMPIDPEKALLIVNGKIMGKNKKVAEEFNQLVAQSITVKWLNRKEAIAKYGSDGADGACEVNYVEGVVFTTTYADANKMSIFYVGMDNPLRVNVPNVKPEDIVVNISEGSITGTNGNYIARVNHSGEVTITLAKRDGTVIPASFTVKVKLLPNTTDPGFPIELRTGEERIVLGRKLNELEVLQEKQKLLVEQQAATKQNYTEKEKLVLERKLNELEVLEDKQKLLSEQKIAIKQNYAEKEKILLDKLSDLEVLKQKQNLLLKEQVATKLNYTAEERVVLGQKLNEQEVLKQKQNLLLKQQATELKEVRANAPSLSADNAMLKEKELLAQKNNIIFIKTEINPQFTGGQAAWAKYVQANLKINTLVEKGARAGKYTVVLKFIVNADGSLSDITCENDPGFGACAEAIRFIKATPKWQPAIQNGKKVNAYLKQPITFIIATDKNTSWHKIQNKQGATVFFVADQLYINFISMPATWASTKPAGLVNSREAYTNKVCSNISVQK